MKEIVTCADAREEFSALLDGELDAEEQDELGRHISECSDCLRELDGLKKVSDTYEALPEVDVPEDLADEIRNEIQPPHEDLFDTSRTVRPVSFKPVLVALIVLAWLAILSYLISQNVSRGGNTPPPLVEEPE